VKKDEELLNAKGRDTHFLKLIMFKMLGIIFSSYKELFFFETKVKASMTRN